MAFLFLTYLEDSDSIGEDDTETTVAIGSVVGETAIGEDAAEKSGVERFDFEHEG